MRKLSFNNLALIPIIPRWFFGRIKRADAEKNILQEGNKSGTFLIRESEGRPGHYSLSVRNGNSVIHYSIKDNQG